MRHLQLTRRSHLHELREPKAAHSTFQSSFFQTSFYQKSSYSLSQTFLILNYDSVLSRKRARWGGLCTTYWTRWYKFFKAICFHTLTHWETLQTFDQLDQTPYLPHHNNLLLSILHTRETFLQHLPFTTELGQPGYSSASRHRKQWFEVYPKTQSPSSTTRNG